MVEIPTTATVRTARGSHYYFRTKESVASRDYPWGEIRSSGRYVVAPKSVHPAGTRYRWHLTPEEAGLADFAELEIAQRDPPTPIRSTCPVGTKRRSTCPTIPLSEIDEGDAHRLARVLGVPEGSRSVSPSPVSSAPIRGRQQPSGGLAPTISFSITTSTPLGIAAMSGCRCRRCGLGSPVATAGSASLSFLSGDFDYLPRPDSSSEDERDGPPELVAIWKGLLSFAGASLGCDAGSAVAVLCSLRSRLVRCLEAGSA
jgi:hypothetical protein